MRIKWRTTFSCLLLVTLALFGQRTLGQPTVLERYVAEGLEANLALQQENLEVQQQVEALKQARSLFMPNVQFNASYTLAAGGRTIGIPIGDLMNPVYTTLNQLTDSEQFPANLENVNEQFLPNDFHDTRLYVEQPLFNSDIYYNYKAQQSLISVQEAKRDAYRQALTKDIKVAYYQYLQSAELLTIYDSTETLLQELVRVNKQLVANHKATPDVVSAAEYELSQLFSEVAAAQQQHSRARNYFNFLLNRPLNSAIEVDAALATLTLAEPDADVEGLTAQALTGREEVAQLRYAQQANEQLLQLNKGSRLPQLSAGMMAGYQGFGYSFDSNQDYALLQLNLSVPLFTGGGNKSRIQQQQLEVKQIKTQLQEVQQQIGMQVNDAYQRKRAAVASIQARQMGLRSAAKTFRLVRRKYEEGQAILVEYLEARTNYTNAQLQLAIARYDYLISDAELNRALAQ